MVPVGVTRSGYTGEDGFEISLPASQALDFARAVLTDGRCKPAGLGARDSLRLEAGLCLYGQDIDETTTPIAAGLGWTIGKNRKGGGFPGAETVLAEQASSLPARKRTGFLLEGRAPIRSGADILGPAGQVVGVVTSGGFGPSVDGLIAMGYVEAEYTAPGTELVFQQKSRQRRRENDEIAVRSTGLSAPNTCSDSYAMNQRDQGVTEYGVASIPIYRAA